MAKKDENINPKVTAALALMRKKFGDESILTFDNTSTKKVDVVSTGSLKLDKCTGIGGLPYSRCVLLWGDYSSGKSSICLHVCANAQKEGKVVAYVDTEHSFDPIYAKNLKCNLNELLFSQPNSGDEALNQIYELANSGYVDVIILDSIAACIPQSEIDGQIGDINIGKQARLFSDFFKKVCPACEKNNVLLLCTNQVRQKPGSYGDSSVMPAGEAQKFYASMILRTRKKLSEKETDSSGDIIANQISVTIEKNKLSCPFRKCDLMIYYGKGLSQDNEVFEIAVNLDIIHKAGAWFSYEGEKIGQGAVKARAWLDEHPDIKANITEKVKEIIMRPEEENFEDSALQSIEEDVKFDPETGEILE